MAHKTPTIEIYTGVGLFYFNGKRSYGDCFNVEVSGNGRWLDWLNSEDHKSFRVECLLASFTVRKESRKDSKNSYWSAFKKINKKLHKIYVGKSEDITPEYLYTIASMFTKKR